MSEVPLYSCSVHVSLFIDGSKARTPLCFQHTIEDTL